MKLLLIKCGICENWHSPSRHCSICGAYSVPRVLSSTGYLNVKGIEMKRAIPSTAMNTVLDRVVKRAANQQ